MTEQEIARLRLASQQIWATALTTPQAVVSWLGAMQGQDYPGVKWSVGLRLPGATDAEIEACIDAGAIVRTWAMRGTLHLIAAEDVHWLLKLVEPEISPRIEQRFEEFGFDAATRARAFELIGRALEGGQRVERLALLNLLVENGIPAKGQPGRYLLHRASAAGMIGQSVAVGNRQTFISLEHLPRTAYTRAEALAELARRYFISRGPATVQDFANWASLKLSDARAGLEAIKDRLVQAKVSRTDYWMSPELAAQVPPEPTVYALPGFDEYLLGYKERGASLDPDHYRFWCPGKNGMFNPTIVSDGRVVGMWKRTFQKDSVLIEAEPIRPLSDAERAGFDADARRYATFVGREGVFVNPSPRR